MVRGADSHGLAPSSLAICAAYNLIRNGLGSLSSVSARSVLEVYFVLLALILIRRSFKRFSAKWSRSANAPRTMRLAAATYTRKRNRSCDVTGDNALREFY